MDEVIYKSTDKAKRNSLSIPFETLQPGQSVFRYESEIKATSLRSLVSNNNLKYEDKRFGVHTHKKEKAFEIYCYSDMPADAINVIESSQEVKHLVSNGLAGRKKYSFFELPEDMSFAVDIPSDLDLATKIEKSLRVQCTVQSKKLGRKFVLYVHKNCAKFEVYCVPKKEEVTATMFFQPSAEMQEKVRSYES